MQLILDIEDTKEDVILNFINNLKEGIVKKIRFIENVSNKEQLEIEQTLLERSVEDKEVSHSKTIMIDI